MTEAQSISAKYIFLDIVGYSHRRSVEAQTDIISTLNHVVRESVAGFNLTAEQLIYLPTGDEICIALLGAESPYDIHIQLSLAILAKLHEYNQGMADVMRRFQIRIGINANIDNLVTDINGERNVSGAGINLAQRVMNAGDGNQILAGEAVFETLRYREKYMRAFKSFTATAKHGINLQVHQLVESASGLDISIPSEFKQKEAVEPQLTKFAAYYFAHATRNREFLKTTLRTQAGGQGSYSCIVLLYMLAYDSTEASSASDIAPYSPHIWNAANATLDKQFEYYNSLDFWVICNLSSFIEKAHLGDYWRYFEQAGFIRRNIFSTQEGREKLQREWPAIWNEFGFKTTQ